MNSRIFLPIFAVVLSAVAAAAGQPLFNIAAAAPKDLETTGRTRIRIDGERLEVSIPARTGKDDMRWPGVNLNPQGKKFFDISGSRIVAMDISNLSPDPVEIGFQIDNEGTNNREGCLKTGIALAAGETATLRVRVADSTLAGKGVHVAGMKDPFDGLPGPNNLDPEKIRRLKLFIYQPGKDFRFAVSGIRLEGPRGAAPEALKSPETFFPCIDRFGQYKHGEWPNKLSSEADFARIAIRENADLAAHPADRTGRTVYGGWADGPALKATGHFYPARYDGKWYLVDPTGRLFWSFGIDSIYLANVTALDGREHYFEELPGPDDPEFGRFHGSARSVARHYKGKTVRTYHIYEANLFRKYGKDYRDAFVKQAAERLPSWGINTIGNWSTAEVIRGVKMPYVAQVNADGAPKIEGDNGYWYKFWDVYSPEFPKALERTFRRNYSFAFDDPRCIGFFIDNELTWGGETGLARSVLASPAAQPGKVAFRDQLREKYGTVEKLNAAWRSAYPDWEAFLSSTTPPDDKFAGDDLAKFSSELIDRYFRLCREAVKTVAPDKLYLGCRFAGGNPAAIRSAAKYADVLSFNRYHYTVNDLPEGIDKPILIGEFHFGTIDGGPGSPGLRPVADQKDRARALTRYIESALADPRVVGAHYFKYSDQPTSGRYLDDENMQIGFTDLCDTPYQEMIDAARELNRKLYRLRSGEKQ